MGSNDKKHKRKETDVDLRVTEISGLSDQEVKATLINIVKKIENQMISSEK